MSWRITPSFTQWTPALISTALWLDAADASTVTTSSGAVSQWNDKSGNGRNFSQGTSDRQPSYISSGINNRSTIKFSTLGTAPDNLSRNDFLSGSSYVSFLFVIKRTSSLSTQRYLSITKLSSGSELAMLILVENSQGKYGLGGRRLVGDTYSQLDETTSTPENANILEAIHDYGNSDQFIRINGSQVAANTNFQTSGSLDTGLSQIGIGGRFDNGVNSNVEIGEVICFTSDPGATNRAKAEGYLAHKWGLTANLPNDHPYKHQVPTPGA